MRRRLSALPIVVEACTNPTTVGDRGRGKWLAALVAEKKLKPPETHATQTFRCEGQPMPILARVEPRLVNANPLTGQGLTCKTRSKANDLCAQSCKTPNGAWFRPSIGAGA
jgi:hypothetical protein